MGRSTTAAPASTGARARSAAAMAQAPAASSAVRAPAFSTSRKRHGGGGVGPVFNVVWKKKRVKVVPSPSLMVLDNHTASIAVGDQTPIQAGTTSNLEGTVTSTNIEYKDTGVN